MNIFRLATAAVFLASGVAIAAPKAEPIGRYKMMELALHRVEKLVQTKKISEDYRKKFEHIELAIDESKPPVYFIIKAHQTQVQTDKPEENKPNEVLLQSEMTGKPLGKHAETVGVAGPDYAWAPVDPLTLSERAAHHIEHLNGEPANTAKIKPFFDGIDSMTLVKGTLGVDPVALIQVTRIKSKDVLNIYLKLDEASTLAKWEVVAGPNP
jgi:hypothetical protein